MLEKTKRPYNRLIFECVFWALSIVENEKKNYPIYQKHRSSGIVSYLFVSEYRPLQDRK